MESVDVAAAMSCECFWEPAWCWHGDDDNGIDGNRGPSACTTLHFVRHVTDLH